MTDIKEQKRLLFNLQFFILCILAGIGSAIFSTLTDKAYLWCMWLFKHVGYLMILYIPALFVLTVYLLKKYFPYAGGSGLPQGYALDIFEEDVLHNTYSLRTMVGKVALTFLSILGGASLGKEGPTIQICASIFASMRNISVNQRKLLIRIGSGVGVATAFNAPLGGIIFAIEEYIKRSETKLNMLLLSGIATAGYCATALYGDYSYMGSVTTGVLDYSFSGVILSVFAGISCGLSGALFTYLVVWVSVDKNNWFSRLRKKHYLLCAGFFGVVVAILGLSSHGLSFGNGAFTVKNFLSNNIQSPAYYSIVKAMGAISSVAAGAPGGYFSTALSIGAGIMAPVHSIFPSVSVAQLYLLGMVGFLAAITNAPITAVVMVMSIVSNSEHYALPLILSASIGSHIASLFGGSVYHQQVSIYVDKDKVSHIHE